MYVRVSFFFLGGGKVADARRASFRAGKRPVQMSPFKPTLKTLTPLPPKLVKMQISRRGLIPSRVSVCTDVKLKLRAEKTPAFFFLYIIVRELLPPISLNACKTSS